MKNHMVGNLVFHGLFFFEIEKYETIIYTTNLNQ